MAPLFSKLCGHPLQEVWDGMQVLQNLHLLTTWLLLKGLQVVLGLNTFLASREAPRGRGTPDQTPTRARDQSAGIKQNLLRMSVRCPSLHSILVCRLCEALCKGVLEQVHIAPPVERC